MPIAPQDFWDFDDWERNPPLTASMIANAQQQLGVTLPPEFIALLQIKNGGDTRHFGFPMDQQTRWASDHLMIYDLNGIGIPDSDDTLRSILDRDEMSQYWELPASQVLLTGEMHCWITLDYRLRADPCVSWIDVKAGQDIVIANSFAAFYARLRPLKEF